MPRAAVGVNVEREVRELLPRDLCSDGFRNPAYNLTVDLAHVEGYAKPAELVARRTHAVASAARFTFLTPRLADHYGLKRTAAKPGGTEPGNLATRARTEI